jgi:hypothetical protein
VTQCSWLPRVSPVIQKSSMEARPRSTDPQPRARFAVHTFWAEASSRLSAPPGTRPRAHSSCARAAFFCRGVDLEMGQPRFCTLPPACVFVFCLHRHSLPPARVLCVCTQDLGNMYRPCSLQVPRDTYYPYISHFLCSLRHGLWGFRASPSPPPPPHARCTMHGGLAPAPAGFWGRG